MTHLCGRNVAVATVPATALACNCVVIVYHRKIHCITPEHSKCNGHIRIHNVQFTYIIFVFSYSLYHRFRLES